MVSGFFGGSVTFCLGLLQVSVRSLLTVSSPFAAGCGNRRLVIILADTSPSAIDCGRCRFAFFRWFRRPQPRAVEGVGSQLFGGFVTLCRFEWMIQFSGVSSPSPG